MTDRTQDKATPRPWKCRPRRSRHRAYWIVADDGLKELYVALVETRLGREKPDAELIVRAVNAHDELVEALRIARGYVKATHGTLAGVMGPENLISPDLAKIDAALAKAEGRESGAEGKASA